ncbi:hypothetical protein BH09BAC1_BH09BAC1_01720 [soil metagenome]
MNTMQNILKSVLCLSLIIFTMSSCSKDDDKNDVVVTEADAADVTASALELNSSGLALELKEITLYIENGIQTLTCAVSHDTIVTKTTTGVTTGTATLNLTYLLNCDSIGDPISLKITGTTSGNYNGPRTEGTHTGSRDLLFAPNSNDELLVNGTFIRTGSFTSKVRTLNSYTATVTVTATNLLITGIDGIIKGGTATVNAKTSVTGGNDFEFNGTVVFNSAGVATLTINGTQYTIALY